MKHQVEFVPAFGSFERDAPSLRDVTAGNAECSPTYNDAELAVGIRHIIQSRDDRIKLLSSSLFADPAWNILLDLFASHLEQQRVTITDVCAGSGVPATTALRWIENLQNEDFLVRRRDPIDARRTFIELSQGGLVRMRAYFDLQVKRKLETRR